MSFILVDGDRLIYPDLLGPELTPPIALMLRSAKCFVPAFIGADEYSVETYISQYAFNRTETHLLLDRNVYSDVIALSEGAQVNLDTRLAAAIMAFAHAAQIQIEPAIAMYEGAASGARGGWIRKLRRFRGVDNIHPSNWAALALGYADCFEKKVPQPKLPQQSYSFKPNMKLRSYRNLYPCILKIALIARANHSPDVKLQNFVQWSFDEWKFSAEAITLAAMIFSKHSLPTPLKSVKAEDCHKVLLGVRNATWDLVYVHEWHRRAKEQPESNKLAIFCSRDAALIYLTNMLRDVLYNEKITQDVQLSSLGFNRDTRAIFANIESELLDSERAISRYRQSLIQYRDGLIRSLEKSFFVEHKTL